MFEGAKPPQQVRSFDGAVRRMRTAPSTLNKKEDERISKGRGFGGNRRFPPTPGGLGGEAPQQKIKVRNEVNQRAPKGLGFGAKPQH